MCSIIWYDNVCNLYNKVQFKFSDVEILLEVQMIFLALQDEEFIA